MAGHGLEICEHTARVGIDDVRKSIGGEVILINLLGKSDKLFEVVCYYLLVMGLTCFLSSSG